MIIDGPQILKGALVTGTFLSGLENEVWREFVIFWAPCSFLRAEKEHVVQNDPKTVVETIQKNFPKIFFDGELGCFLFLGHL